MIILEWNAWDSFLCSEVFPVECRCFVNPFVERNAEFYTAILPQINLTSLHELPIDLEGLLNKHRSKGLPFLNAGLFDISKKTIHSLIHSRYGQKLAVENLNSNDMVMVKSNLNYGGELERRYIENISPALKDNLPPESFGSGSYYLASLGDVKHIINDPKYSVEKYITNSEDKFYRCYVAGEHLIVVEAYSDAVIKKLQPHEKNINYLLVMENGKILGQIDYLPPFLLKTITETIDLFQIDYAAIDMVCDDDDNFFVVDINTTPSVGIGPLQSELCDFLLHGVQKRIQHLMNNPV